KGMSRRSEWIDRRHPGPGETFLKVLGQKQTTPPLCGSREDDRIPYAQLVVHREIGRREHSFGGSLDHGKCIAPTQQSIAGFAARLSCLANEDIEKLAENLDRDDAGFLRKFANEGQSGVTPLSPVDTFRVGEDVRVEGDLHLSSS